MVRLTEPLLRRYVLTARSILLSLLAVWTHGRTFIEAVEHAKGSAGSVPDGRSFNHDDT